MSSVEVYREKLDKFQRRIDKINAMRQVLNDEFDKAEKNLKKIVGEKDYEVVLKDLNKKRLELESEIEKANAEISERLGEIDG